IRSKTRGALMSQRQFCEQNKCNTLAVEFRSYSGMAERSNFLAALCAIVRIQVGIETRMAAELGCPCRKRTNYPAKIFDANSCREWMLFPAPMKFSAERNARIKISKWQSEVARDFRKHRPHRLLIMNMLVRIEMGWIAAGKVPK